jgi:AraC-like DNA-binding protein
MQTIDKMITDDNLQSLAQYGDQTFRFEIYCDTGSDGYGKYIDRHWHDEFQISIIVAGETTFFMDLDKITLRKGDVIFFNKEVIHSYKVLKGSVYSIIFADEFISPATSKVYMKYIMPIESSNFKYFVAREGDSGTKELRNMAMKLLADEHLDDGLMEHHIFVDVVELWDKLFNLIKDDVKKSGSKPMNSWSDRIRLERLREMLSFIHNNYMEQISIENIAGAANVSKSEALRCFHQFLNDTPQHYVTMYRLDKSKHFLKTSGCSIEDVAWKTGFSSAGYFCRVFKTHNGLTPNTYRHNSSMEQRG